MEEKRYILVWRDSFSEVEKLSLNEFKEYVYEDYEDGCKKLYEDVEVNDIGNGLISYLSIDSSWMIVELE